jgi:hypothetical protein
MGFGGSLLIFEMSEPTSTQKKEPSHISNGGYLNLARGRSGLKER